jgi:signal transduction histidine kinase
MQIPSDLPESLSNSGMINAIRTEYQTKITQLIQDRTQQSAFMARMIHELRTPLNSIMGFLELVCDGKFGALTQEQGDILGTVYKSAQYMLGLVNTVLDIAKIEHGDVVLDVCSFSLSELIGELIIMFEPLTQKKSLGLTFQNEGISLIIADRQRLKQVLINFIQNAIKFTEHGTILIRAWEDMQDVHIVIQDPGIGISEAHLGLLFQPFSRIESPNTEGTGLGLYISKIIVELHGGKIQVKSTPKIGTTFTITIPTLL